MTKVLTYSFGLSFPMPAIVLGYVLVFAGAIGFFEQPIVGLIVFAIGGFLAWSGHGTQINMITRQYREYGLHFGIMIGDWKSFDAFPNLAILSGRKGQTVYSSGNLSTTVVDEYVSVCLLSPDHRKRVVIQSFDSPEPAYELANYLNTILELPIVKYSPPISEKTRKRRERTR